MSSGNTSRRSRSGGCYALEHGLQAQRERKFADWDADDPWQGVPWESAEQTLVFVVLSDEFI